MATVAGELREIIGGSEEVLHELDRIAAENDGDLTPEQVVEAAREKDSPLHSRFEWDDSLAAVEYRKVQARQIIASYKIHVVDGSGESTVRLWTNVVVHDEHVYRKTEEVLKVDGLREQQRIRLRRDLIRLRGELQTWEAFAAAAAKVGEAIDTLDTLDV